MSFWMNRRVLITGGASFIGSHLTDALVERGAKVRIVDDLSSGKLENIQHHLARGTVEFIQADLREPGVARMAMRDIEIVFHLAADHGGRGYVDLHQAGPASNLFLDGLIFWEALKAGGGESRLRLFGLRLPELPAGRSPSGDLPHRGSGEAALRC